MSLDLRPVGVRLSNDAYEALSLIARIERKDLGEVAREILTESLMGKGHVVRLTAERFARAIKSDKQR